MEKITLTHPITVDGTVVTALKLRRPKVRDRLAVEKIGKTDAEKEVALIANLAELPVESIEELDLSDYAQIQMVLQGFLLPSLATT